MVRPWTARSHVTPITLNRLERPHTQALGARIAGMKPLPEEAVAVFFSAPTRNRENDVSFEYRQDSDLFYLTGFDEPQSVLVLSNRHDEHRAILFVRPREGVMHGVPLVFFLVEPEQREIGDPEEIEIRVAVR